MKALVFAAGLGTRLRPITDTLPKALVEVGGKPMLERVIEKIAATGIREFVVNVHHFADKIEDFLASKDNFGLDIQLSREPEEPLETGGGIRHAAPLLRGCGTFLVHNADILSDIDLDAFVRSYVSGSLATLAVVDAQADRYFLFDGDMRLVGWTNIRTGEVKSPYRNLDVTKCRRYSFCGIHVISEKVLELMEPWGEKFPIVDFYLSLAADYPIYGTLLQNVHIVDIGSPEKLREANELVIR